MENFAADDDSYYAKMTRAYVMPHRSWLIANERRHQMRLLWDRFFDDWDVMICPAAASAAFPHDHVGDRHERTIEVNGKRVPTTDQLFWAGYSCGFLPAIDGGAAWPHAAGPAFGGADHHAAVWRLHFAALCRIAGEGIRQLCSAAGVLNEACHSG